MGAAWAAMPTDWNPAQDAEKALSEHSDPTSMPQRAPTECLRHPPNGKNLLAAVKSELW